MTLLRRLPALRPEQAHGPPSWTLAVALLAIAALAVTGGVAPAAVALVGMVAVTSLVRAAPADERGWLLTVVTALLAAHLIVAVALHLALVFTTGSGLAFEDDSSYQRVGAAIAQGMHGGAGVSSSDLYLLNAYTALVGILYYVVGPALLAAKALNSALIVAAALLTYLATRQFASVRAARIALILVGAFPSLSLWAALNLKESLAIALVMACVWLAGKLARGPRPGLTIIATIGLLALEETRRYAYLVAVIAIPTFLAIAPSARLAKRLAYGGASGVVLAFITWSTGSGLLSANSAIPTSFAQLPSVRANMAVDARTAFVPPSDRELVVGEGAAFAIEFSGSARSTSSPGAAASPDGSPEAARIIVVPPGTRLIPMSSAQPVSGRGTARPGTASPSPFILVVPSPTAVVVQPGDVVVVSRSGAATPPPEVPTVGLTPERAAVVLVPGESVPVQPADAVAVNVRHLPVGLAMVLAAPFPWQASTIQELLTVPEMILWYVVVILAVVGILNLVQRRQVMAALVILTAVGLAGVLALIEGNTGTLFRHRAMLIPLVAAIAGHGYAVLERSRIRLART